MAPKAVADGGLTDTKGKEGGGGPKLDFPRVRKEALAKYGVAGTEYKQSPFAKAESSGYEKGARTRPISPFTVDRASGYDAQRAVDATKKAKPKA